MVEKLDDKGVGQGINFLELLQVLLKRKMLILAICCLTALLSAAYSMTLPNIYAATAKVLPPQKESGGLSSVLGQMGVAGIAAGGGKGSDNELYLSILKSRSVGSAVIQRLELGSKYKTKSFQETWSRLDAAIKVQGGRDGIITVTAEDEDPRQAAVLANTMVEELGRTLVRLNLSKVGAERLFLEKRLELVRGNLKAAEDELKNYSQRHKIVQVQSQADASVSSVAKMKSELANKEVQLAVLRTSQSDDSFQVQELQAGIKRLRQNIAGLAGNGSGGEGIPSLGEVPGVGLEYSRKMRELKTQEALFEQLTKQYEMAKLNEAKDSSSMQILDEAVAPEHKIRPKRSTIVLMATVAALVASIILAFALEYLEKLSDVERKVFENLRRQALSLR